MQIKNYVNRIYNLGTEQNENTETKKVDDRALNRECRSKRVKQLNHKLQTLQSRNQAVGTKANSASFTGITIPTDGRVNVYV